MGGAQNTEGPHVFRKHFEEIEIGDTVITDTHLVTLDNINDFAELQEISSMLIWMRIL